MNGTDDPQQRRVRSLGELNRDIPPRRDLWPSIEAGLVPARPASRAPRWALGLAASVVLVAGGVWLGRASLERAASPADPSVVLAAFAPGASYEAARDAELAALPGRLAALSPQTRTQVLASLETVQRSIAEIRQALGRDPANALLQSMLIDSYQEEMRVLSTLNAAGAAGQEI
jgi:hypothetical protein